MKDRLKLLDKNSVVEAIAKFGEDDLRFINHLIVERLKLMHQAKTTITMAQFSVGDKISFDDPSGNHVRGVVSKLNKKTISVITDAGTQWNIPPRFLKLEERAWGEGN